MTDVSPTTRALALLAVCLAAVAMPLTFTGPAVALPAIGRAFGAVPLALAWVTNAFMLTFGSSLMAAGALADAHGRKRLFLIGVAAFIATSLAAAASPGIAWLDLARAGQGVAAAAAFSGGAAALAQVFEGPGRLRAFSLLGTSFGVGLALGPIAAGWLIETAGWRAIFLLVAGLGLPAFLLGMLALRESRDPAAAGLDWPGAASFTAALALFTYGLLLAPERGWGDGLVWALIAGAAAVFAAFVVIEGRVARPMLDLSLFRYPRFVGVQVLAAAPAYSFVVLLILLPVRFIGVEGLAEMAAGRLMVALSAPLIALPVAAGLATRWLSPAVLCGAGFVVAGAGLAWLAQMPAAASTALPLMVIGLGISLPWGLMDGLAVSVVPRERAGMATGIFSTTRVAGEGVALAVVGAILSALTATRLGGGAAAGAAAQHLAAGDLAGATAILPDAGLLHQAYGAAFASLLGILTVITLVTAVVVFLFLGKGPAVPAD
jgi:MFS family permease